MLTIYEQYNFIVLDIHIINNPHFTHLIKHYHTDVHALHNNAPTNLFDIYIKLNTGKLQFNDSVLLIQLKSKWIMIYNNLSNLYNFVQKIKPLHNNRLIIWDFDKTLVKYHMSNIDIANIVDESHITINNTTYTILDIFYDLLFFKNLVKNLLDDGYKLAIASFGKSEIIKKIMSFVFPNTSHFQNSLSDIDISHNMQTLITTPNDFVCDAYFENLIDDINESIDGTDLLENKNKQIVGVSLFWNIHNDNVMFYDDNVKNVNSAKCMGYYNSIVVPKCGFTNCVWKTFDQCMSLHDSQ